MMDKREIKRFFRGKKGFDITFESFTWIMFALLLGFMFILAVKGIKRLFG